MVADALDVEDLLRVPRALRVTGELRTGDDLGAVDDAGREVRAHRHCVDLLLTVVGDDREGALTLLVLADAHHAGGLREDRRALRRAGLEELDDTRQTVGDVLTRDTTGVEGPHGELRARLTDRLGRDDADGLAEVDELAGGEHRAVAEAADAGAVLLVDGRRPRPARRPLRRRGARGYSHVSTDRTRTRVTAVSSTSTSSTSSVTSVLRGTTDAVGERDVLGQARG